MTRAKVGEWFGHTRQLTGTPFVHHCYVSRDNGTRVITDRACKVKHRKTRVAQDCADREARRRNIRGYLS